MALLHDDLLWDIFMRATDVEDLISIASVSVQWRDVARSDLFQRRVLTSHPLVDARLRAAFARIFAEDREGDGTITYDDETGLMYIDGSPWPRILRFAHRFKFADMREWDVIDQDRPWRVDSRTAYLNRFATEEDSVNAERDLHILEELKILVCPGVANSQQIQSPYEDENISEYMATNLVAKNAIPSTTLVPPRAILRLIFELMTPDAELPAPQNDYFMGYSQSFLHNFFVRLVCANDLTSLSRFYAILSGRIYSGPSRDFIYQMYSHDFIPGFGDVSAAFFRARESGFSRHDIYRCHMFAVAAALNRLAIVNWAVTTAFPFRIDIDDDRDRRTLGTEYPLNQVLAHFPLESTWWKRILYSILMPAIRYGRYAVVALLIEHGLAPLWVLHRNPEGDPDEHDALAYARYKRANSTRVNDDSRDRVVQLLEEADRSVREKNK